jgi:NADH-quinone oxidoreductase subunit L
MTRQMCYVFFGKNRATETASASHSPKHHHDPHESPAAMTVPLAILAVFAVLLGFIGTPMWPWFQKYLGGESAPFNFEMLLLSTAIVAVGIGVGWWLYGKKPIQNSGQPDVLEKMYPDIFSLLKNKFYVDEFYEFTVIRLNAWWCDFCDWLDYWVWQGSVFAVSYAIIGLSWVSRVFDEYVINLGFDESCQGVTGSGKWLSRLENGQVQSYLRVIGVALAVLGLILLWGCSAS